MDALLRGRCKVRRVKYEVLNVAGARIGELTIEIHQRENRQALERRFRSYPGGFGFLLDQIPIDDVFPIAEFHDVEISHAERKRGYGRDAMRAFNVLALRGGAKIGFLRVATQGEEYESGLEWRKRFYGSEGWRELKNPPDEMPWPECMFHLLDTCTKTSRDISLMLREVDELEEHFRMMSSWTARFVQKAPPEQT